jgi:hypothetical protein
VETLDYMFYATGLIAVYQLLKVGSVMLWCCSDSDGDRYHMHSLDELHRITKRLRGEVPLAGYLSWREEYERLHMYSRV